MSEPNLILESKRLCEELTNKLPVNYSLRADAHFISDSGKIVATKIPTKVMAVIGSLGHRAKDFGELSSELFDRNRVVPAIVIARALMETTALLYLAQKKMAEALKSESIIELDGFLVKCMSGNRLHPTEPDSPNILTAIQQLDKEEGCERYADFYNVCCEFAHPNSLGTFYAYTELYPDDLHLRFGENKGMTKANDSASAVVFALEVFIEFYDRAIAMIPQLNDLSIRLYDGSIDQ